MKKSVTLGVVFLVLGVVSAILVLPMITSNVPHELRRSKSIRTHTDQQEMNGVDYLFVGNSVIMNGIDCRHFDEISSTVSYNLSSTGQTLSESIMVVDSVGEFSGTIVLGITRAFLCSSSILTPETKSSAYAVYDYEMSDDCREILTKLSDTTFLSVYDKPSWRRDLDSRWMLRGAIDIKMRQTLRRDIDFSKAINDLKFPSPYSKKAKASLVEREIESVFGNNGLSAIHPNKIEAIEMLGKMVKSRGGKLVLLLQPEHPWTEKIYSAVEEEQFQNSVQSLTPQNFTIIDTTRLLAEDQFYDALHPSAEGAKLLTERIYRQLR